MKDSLRAEDERQLPGLELRAVGGGDAVAQFEDDVAVAGRIVEWKPNLQRALCAVVLEAPQCGRLRGACSAPTLTASTAVNVQRTFPLKVSGFISRENCRRMGAFSGTSISPSAGSVKITSGGGPICGIGGTSAFRGLERRLGQRDLLPFDPHETLSLAHDPGCFQPRACVHARSDIEIEAPAARPQAGDPDRRVRAAEHEVPSGSGRVPAAHRRTGFVRETVPTTFTFCPMYADGFSAIWRSDGAPSDGCTAIALVTVSATTSPGRGQSPSSPLGSRRSRPSVAIRGSSRCRRPTSQKLARSSTGPSTGEGPLKISGIDRSTRATGAPADRASRDCRARRRAVPGRSRGRRAAPRVTRPVAARAGREAAGRSMPRVPTSDTEGGAVEPHVCVSIVPIPAGTAIKSL